MPMEMAPLASVLCVPPHPPDTSMPHCREIRGLKDSLLGERDRMARMQQFDSERLRHLNVELQASAVCGCG